MRLSSILARILGFRQRIIPEPRVPSRGSQAQGTRLLQHGICATRPRTLVNGRLNGTTACAMLQESNHNGENILYASIHHCATMQCEWKRLPLFLQFTALCYECIH
jgi:hypothetical protein